MGFESSGVIMKTLTLIQGTPEWHAHRRMHHNASDAPAMMGESPYKQRSELLHELYTGIPKEVTPQQQKVFDDGHRREKLARPIAEEIVGESLYPVTGTEGKYSASFDGLTMAEHIAFEHKSLNDDLRAAFDAGEPVLLPLYYRIQMEHQLLVSNAEKVLFMASNWDLQGNLIEERHCWYEPDLELRAQIVAGWDQLEKDLADFVPREIKEAPKAEVVIELPALFVHAVGEITQSNMKEFGEALAARLEEVRAIELVTDQDFANAKGAAKMFRDQIIKLKATKEAMLSQTVTIGEASRMIDAWSEDLRVTALQLEKDVEREDLAKKRAMVTAGDYAFMEHMKALEAEVKPIRLVVTEPNFAEAIKGKRNYASMQDAVDTLLSQAKANADQVALDVRNKLAWCKTNADGYGFLFADLQQIIYKPADDFQLLITSRIEQHKKDEEAKLEAERERIRKEEEAKAAAKVAAEQAAQTVAETATQAVREMVATGTVAIITSANDDGMKQTVIPASELFVDDSTVKLGEIHELLGFPITAKFIQELGITPAEAKGSSVLYRCADVPEICVRLIASINAAKVDFIEAQRARKAA
jgi:putative phage-type endonuclease